jgi:hypothetical protein
MQIKYLIFKIISALNKRQDFFWYLLWNDWKPKLVLVYIQMKPWIACNNFDEFMLK